MQSLNSSTNQNVENLKLNLKIGLENQSLFDSLPKKTNGTLLLPPYPPFLSQLSVCKTLNNLNNENESSHSCDGTIASNQPSTEVETQSSSNADISSLTFNETIFNDFFHTSILTETDLSQNYELFGVQSEMFNQPQEQQVSLADQNSSLKIEQNKSAEIFQTNTSRINLLGDQFLFEDQFLKEFEANLDKFDTNDFNKSKLTNKMGLFEGENFRKWIEEKIQAKLGVENATFKDLQMKVSKEGSSKYKNIFLTGSNLSTGKCEIFSHLHSPNMIIADAVRISMSIPIFFNPHQCFIKDDQGKRYVDSNKIDSLYVDGGLLNNYPIRMFDTTRITDDSETNFINKETLGFKLVSSDLKSKYDSMFKDLKSADKRIDKFGTFLSMLVNFYKDSEETNHSDRIKDQERTIYIDNCGISPIEFDLKDTDKSNLIDSGRQGVEDYFQMKRNKKSNVLLWQPKVCYHIIDFLFF